MQLHKELNAGKATAFPWRDEVSQCAPQEALRDLDKAYKNLLRRVELPKQGKWKGKLGLPKPKKRSKGIGSLRLTGSIHVFEKSIQG
jgi:putative transposase